MKKFLTQINNKKSGQSLLMVVVISTLALLIMVSMADRILLTQVNVERIAQFDRAVAEAENKANQIISIVTDMNNTNVVNCLNTLSNINRDFVEIECLNVGSPTTKVYGRLSPNSAVTLSSSSPRVMLKLSQSLSSGVSTGSVSVRCDGLSNGVQLIVTRAYLDNNGIAKVEKGRVRNCGRNSTYVEFYDVSNGIRNSTNMTRNNTLYVTARLLSQNVGNVGVTLSVYGSDGNLLATTQKYEFIVTGIGGLTQDNVLGSDAIVTFERGAGQTIIGFPGIFDYVYLEE